MKCHSIGQTVQYYMPSRRSRDLTHLSGRYQYGEWGLIPHSPKRVLMRCKFRAVTSHWRQFFSCEMKLWWILRALVTDQSKYEKNQRSGRLESNAVQSSRSKSSPRTGHVLRFLWKSVATSDFVHKSLETMSSMILNRSLPKIEAKSFANEMWCLNA